MPPIVERNLVRILVALVFVLLIAGFVTLRSCQAERTAKTETRLSKGQADAAVKSGSDAVETVGNRMAADRRGDQTVQETKDAINNASDAVGVDAAGRAGLCRLAGYSRRPECVR
jgi:type VI protein secretion system component VasK